MSSASEKLYFKLVPALFLVFICFSDSALQAQSRKASANHKKNKALAQESKNKKDSAKNKKVSAKDAKLSRAEKIKLAEEKKRAAIAEQKRRAAIAARQKAIREARAKKLAFERGLRTETIANIAKDNIEGEDLDVRRAAVNALGKHAGTVVVMEPQTGKILTIVNQDWAIRRSFKPCSTIKLVTGVAGLNEQLIEKDGSIKTSNFRMNLDDALAYSNNGYFQRVGGNLGSNKMITYAKELGLGQPTGINAPNETGGKLPYGNNNARIYSHGDDFEVTPLQLAVMVSAISNGGRVIVPQIPKNRVEKTNFRGSYRRQINLPKQSLQGVIPGMIGAAEYGTARRGVDSTLDVAGKTGSCIGQGSWVGLFASVAPIENPKFAVIVITRGQSERGKYAAAIAGQIYNSLRVRFDEGRDKNLAKIPLEYKPQTKIDAKTAAALDDAADEDSDEEGDKIAKDEDFDESEDITVRKGKKGDGDIVSTAPKTAAKKDVKAVNPFTPVVIEVKKRDEAPFTRPRIVTNK